MKKSKKIGLYYTLVFFFGVLLLSTELSYSLADNSGIIIFGNKMSVNLKEVSLSSVLKNMHKKIGIKYFLAEGETNRKISVKFESLSMEEGLKRILDKFNYLIIFGPDAHIQEVIIIGKRKKSFKSLVRESIIPSASSAMIIVPPSGESMKISPPPDADAMIITPLSGEGMKVSPPSDADAMIITPPSKEGMKTTTPRDADAMITEPPS